MLHLAKTYMAALQVHLWAPGPCIWRGKCKALIDMTCVGPSCHSIRRNIPVSAAWEPVTPGLSGRTFSYRLCAGSNPTSHMCSTGMQHPAACHNCLSACLVAGEGWASAISPVTGRQLTWVCCSGPYSMCGADITRSCSRSGGLVLLGVRRRSGSSSTAGLGNCLLPCLATSCLAPPAHLALPARLGSSSCRPMCTVNRELLSPS